MIPIWMREPDPDIYMSDNYVVLDFETTNINKGDPRHSDNRIVMSCYKLGEAHPDYDGTAKVIWGNEFRQAKLLDVIERADYIVCHNTKFEIQWLMRCGLKPHRVLPYDTLLGKYVEDGNRIRPRDLNSVAAHFGLGSKTSSVDRMIKGGVCPSEIPRSLLQTYGAQDVILTEQVFLLQRERLFQEELLPIAFTRNIFTPVLADVEMNGMQLDEDLVQDYYREFTRVHATVLQELNTFAEGINWKSPNQVAGFVYGELGFSELTKDGKPIRNKANKAFPEGLPKTDKDTLLALKATNKKQKRFTELFAKNSKLEKSITTYLKLFKETCEEKGGRLLGKFNQAVTQTHRLSSSQPNFQNFDRNFKQLFTSRRRKDGWIIGERDAAQLEFRAAAYLGGDTVAMQDIAEGFDVHTYTADIIGVGRTAAKAHTFKPLYGGTSGTANERKYYKAFKEKYRSIADTQDQWVRDTLMSKVQVLPTGLKLYWPRIKMTPSGYVEGNTNVRNYPVQNLATAEIIPVGVTYVWHHMKDRKLQSLLINTVHDSMITDENPEETEELNEITTTAFSQEVVDYLDKVYDIQFDVPLEVDVELADNWGYKAPKFID